MGGQEVLWRVQGSHKDEEPEKVPHTAEVERPSSGADVTEFRRRCGRVPRRCGRPFRRIAASCACAAVHRTRKRNIGGAGADETRHCGTLRRAGADFRWLATDLGCALSAWADG